MRSLTAHPWVMLYPGLSGHEVDLDLCDPGETPQVRLYGAHTRGTRHALDQ